MWPKSPTIISEEKACLGIRRIGPVRSTSRLILALWSGPSYSWVVEERQDKQGGASDQNMQLSLHPYPYGNTHWTPLPFQYHLAVSHCSNTKSVRPMKAPTGLLKMEIVPIPAYSQPLPTRIISILQLVHYISLTRFPCAMAFILWKASMSWGKWEQKASTSFRNLMVWRYLTDARSSRALMSNGLSMSGSGRPNLKISNVSAGSPVVVNLWTRREKR